jgi:hypothetical protein
MIRLIGALYLSMNPAFCEWLILRTRLRSFVAAL